jgi:hypothetical protein
MILEGIMYNILIKDIILYLTEFLDPLSYRIFRSTCKKFYQWIPQNIIVFASTQLHIAALNNYLDVLKWLYEIGFKPHNMDNTLTWNAEASGNLEMLKWTIDIGCDLDFNAGAISARNGRIDIVYFLLHHPRVSFKTLCEEAARANQFELIQYLETFAELSDTTCTYAALGNNFDLLKYLVSRDYKLNEKVFECAMYNFNPEMFEWLLEMKCPYDNQTFVAAISSGNMDTCNWLKNHDFPLTRGAFAKAANSGSIKILEWLKDNECPWNEAVCWNAAYYSKLENLKWLRENGCPWNVQNILEFIAGPEDAEDGDIYLEIRNWILQNS